MKALVLSGGGAKGLIQTTILSLLKKDGLDFDSIGYISGVSIGAVIGALVVQNDVDTAIDLFPTMKNSDIYSGKLNIWNALWQRFRGKNFVLDASPLFKLLQKYISLEKAKRSNKIFHIGLVDYKIGKYVSYTQHDFESNDDYIRCIIASASQPMIWTNSSFKTIDEFIEFGYDGGVIHISPIGEVLQYNPTEVIIINASSIDVEIKSNFNHVEQVLMRTIDLMLSSNFRKDINKFIELNYNARKFGKYCDVNGNIIKPFAYKLFQSDLIDEDSLNFERTDLLEKRVENAIKIYKNQNTKCH